MAKSEMADVEDNPSVSQEDPTPKKTRQFLAAFAGNIACILVGCVMGWTSPSLPHLEDVDSPIPITTDENSWISSLTPLAAAVGPWPAGFLAEKFGRKKALLFSFIPSVIGYGCLAGASSVAVIYVGRIFSGLVIGWVFTVLPIYSGEIAHKDVRGAIGSLIQVSIGVGLLFDYCIGPYVPYMWLSIATLAIPVLFVAAFVWMPESPYYLLGRDDRDGATTSLIWLRGHSSVTQELKNMQAEVEKAQSQTGSFKDLFATKGNTKALILSMGLVGFQQLSGRYEAKPMEAAPSRRINVVLFNAQSIFEAAGGSLTPDVSTIVIGAVMLVASLTTPFMVDRLGRKILLLVSAVGMAVSHAVLGLCFYLQSHGTDISSFAILPVLSVIVFIVVFSFGFGSLAWAIVAEMFPPNIKSLGSALTASFCWLLSFLLTRFFNDLVAAIGNEFTFWIFAICSILAAVFVLFLLPETKGKTLAEIQDILNR